MELHRSAQIDTRQACSELGLGKSQFHRLRTSYLRACADARQHLWQPQGSGGARHPQWPTEAQALALKLLKSDPPASYSLVASELLRRLKFPTGRSTVRRWAAANGCALPRRALGKDRASVRRWQRQSVGELWQMDATPHVFAPGEPAWHLIEIIDDCSRLVTGARLYERELLLSYYDLLPRAFTLHGLPLALYVDWHSFFYTSAPGALTELGEALHFYGVSLRYAPTPQAKGKVERLHQYWQNRLPALFGAEGIGQVERANALLEELREHRNREEVHQELKMKPQTAWNLALGEGRSVLRPCPRDPWWHHVWSRRTSVRVGDDGRVPVGGQRFRIKAKPRTRVVHCLHTNGSVTILANQPDKKERPKILLQVGPKPD